MSTVADPRATGEVSKGQKEWIRSPVFYQETGSDGRVYLKYDPYFIKSLTRFSDKGKQTSSFQRPERSGGRSLLTISRAHPTIKP